MYSVVIPCAGKGTRTKLNVNKLLYKVDGLHLIEYTISKFIYDPDFTEIILVVSKKELKKFEMFTSNKIKLVVGGEFRQESVCKGIEAATNDVVFIHDGARPLVSTKIIKKCKKAMQVNSACVVGLPLSDSLKEIKDNKFKTITRENKYIVQTPQCGKRELLLDVHKRAKHQKFIATDDIALIEKYSDEKISLVKGSIMNIKVTYKEDFDVFDKLRR
ncbi:2-C-methyl-D-erythritol 4-phosphate cytidylyltransferase [Mycoplasmatota bacterium]|nr:2-C-methyl-D-erythritol 4-phosphate cytidylyltransferase [Mycoplasmatota bacterium]